MEVETEILNQNLSFHIVCCEWLLQQLTVLLKCIVKIKFIFYVVKI